MSDKYEKYLRHIPKVFNLGSNPVITAFIEALSNVQDETNSQISNLKEQLFIKTADGIYLTRLASSLGVERHPIISLNDEKFRELIPNLSLKYKTLKKSLYDIADIFWSPLVTRANISTLNIETFNISAGESIIIKRDAEEEKEYFFTSLDIAVNGAATAEEVVTFLNKIDGITASEIYDLSLLGNIVNVRTDTPGPRGSIRISGGTAVGVSKLNFNTDEVLLTDFDQRFSVYHINNNELIIEIPVLVEAVARNIYTAHYLHETSTIETTDWKGAFIFDSQIGNSGFTITSESFTINQNIEEGEVLTELVVDDTSSLTKESGELIISFGYDGLEEARVPYIGIINSKTIKIDPSYIFQTSHTAGEVANVMILGAYTVKSVVDDRGFYLASPTDARAAVESILETILAAGVVATFVVLAPNYAYLDENPLLS